MKFSGLKSILFSMSMTLSVQANDLLDLSQTYSDSYVSHMNYRFSDLSDRDDLQAELSKSTQELSALRSSLAQLEREQSQSQRNLEALKQKRNLLSSETSELQQRIQFLLSEFYPQHGSVASLRQGIQSQRQFHRENIRIVQDEIDKRAKPFQDRIDLLSNENSHNQKLLAQLNQDKSNYNRNLSSALREKESLTKKEAALKRRMANRAALNAEVAQAQKKYEEAKKKKGDRKCILGGLFSSKCRDYLKAKEALADIKEIQSGKRLREVQNDLKQANLKITDNRTRLDRTIARQRSIEGQVKTNQNEILGLEARITRVTSSLRSELIQRRVDLNQFESSLTNANRIFDHQNTLTQKRSDLNAVKGEISTLQSQIPLFPSRIAATQSDIRIQSSEVSANQAALLSFETQLRKKKETLLISENQLKVALASVESVELPYRAENFPAQRIYSSRDWSFDMTEGSVFDVASTTCMAKTSASSSSGLQGHLLVGKVLLSHGRSEPAVAIQLKADLGSSQTTDLKAIQVSVPNSSKSYSFNLVPSLSSSDGELIFMAELGGREELIKVILAEYSLKAVVESSQESLIFSLLGSTNTLKASSQSLAKRCGGIEIAD